jgi:hypothetical protein
LLSQETLVVVVVVVLLLRRLSLLRALVWVRQRLLEDEG